VAGSPHALTLKKMLDDLQADYFKQFRGGTGEFADISQRKKLFS
jgi:hypothetical protein